MKILFIISSLDKCGPVNQLFELLSSNYSLSDSVILTLKKNCSSPRNKDFELIGIEVKAAQSRKINPISLYLSVKREILIGAYDVVCSQGVRGDFYCALLSPHLRKSIVSIVHNYIYPDYRDKYSLFNTVLMTVFHLWSLPRLREIISVSDSVSNYLQNQYGIKSLAIPNGVSLKKYISNVTPSNLNKLIGLYIGPLIKRKSVGTLLDSFSRLNRVDFEINIIGDGDHYEFLKDKYSFDSRIRFHGFRDDIDDIFRQSNFYVSSSRAEGLPMSVLEALSHGLFCLLSDIPPHQEISKEFPTVAKITDFSNSNEIEFFLNSIYTSGSRTDRLSNFNGSRFSSQKMAAGYLKVFNEISNKR